MLLLPPTKKRKEKKKGELFIFALYLVFTLILSVHAAKKIFHGMTCDNRTWHVKGENKNPLCFHVVAGIRPRQSVRNDY